MRSEMAVTTPFVDCWAGRVSAVAADVDACWLLLSADEQRAFQSLPSAARDQKILMRGYLRTILADYLSDDPKQLMFEKGVYGKPFLVGHALQFNVSHSADYWAIAVSNLATVGIDVEVLRPRPSLDKVARRCFSEAEYVYWQLQPAHEQLLLFYRLWTIKEAFVKAVGRGLALGLSGCEVDCVSFDRLLQVPAVCGTSDDWRVQLLSLDAGRVGAVVIPSSDCVLRYFSIKKPQ